MTLENSMRTPARCPGLTLLCLLAAGILTSVGAVEDPGRLTRHPVEPLAQALELHLDPAADSYSGKVAVDLIVHAPARTIRLHAQDLELGATLVRPKAGGESVPLAVERGELGLLVLSAPEPLSPGAYILEIAFAGKYRRDGVGLYKTEVDGTPYLFTQFEARYGRLAFPAWDEPAFKFPWQVTLTVPADLQAFSNSEVVVESTADGWRTMAFARTPPMPTYLVALAVGSFDSVPVSGMSVPGRIITVRGQAGLAEEIARETPRILATLEEYFGTPYPFGKLDQIAVPEFTFGGMENAGLITYRDTTILRPPGDTDESNRRELIRIVAHEVAHHWYGNLVTMEWWNDLWLNESFASWMEGKVVSTAYPELRYGATAIGGKQQAMRLDALPSAGPVRRSITAADDPEKFIDTLSYEKGEAVLTMVESWIGPEAFRAAMKRYFEKHRWGSTRGEDLWSAFSEVSGDDVSSMVASFFEQAGVPQISIEVLPGDAVSVRQERYVALGNAFPAGMEEPLWQVPVVLKFGGADGVRTARLRLSRREQVIDVPGISSAAWIFPNAGEAGYYRWRLDAPREAALVARGLPALEVIERLGVLLNAAAMHDAGHMPSAAYLKLLVAFAQDPMPDVAQRAVDAMRRFQTSILDDEDAEAFAAFCRTALKPVMGRVGFEPAAGEATEIAGLRRALILTLGVRGDDPDVVAKSRALAMRLLEDPRSVDAERAEAALTVAAWHGDTSLFDACERAFRAAAVPTDRSMFLAALGGFRDLALCERGLALSFGPGLRSHERGLVPFVMSGKSVVHRRRVVGWMMEHFEQLRTILPEYYTSGLILLAEGPDSTLFVQAREYLSAPKRLTDSAAKNIAEATDRDAQRQAVRAVGLAEVRSFLASYRSSGTGLAER